MERVEDFLIIQHARIHNKPVMATYILLSNTGTRERFHFIDYNMFYNIQQTIEYELGRVCWIETTKYYTREKNKDKVGERCGGHI